MKTEQRNERKGEERRVAKPRRISEQFLRNRKLYTKREIQRESESLWEKIVTVKAVTIKNTREFDPGSG